jgi:uncharacterized protein HemY
MIILNLIILIFLILPVLIFLVVQLKKTQTRISQYPSKTLIEQGNPQKIKQLLKMVNFDIEIANRLVNNLAKQYPNKSVDWYIKKAIEILRSAQNDNMSL